MDAHTKRIIKVNTEKFIFHAVVILLGFIMLYPILWMISNSFKTSAEIFGNSSLIPQSLRWDNYVRGWKFNNAITFGTFFKNSLFYTVVATFGAVMSSAIVAYGFARIPFKGRSFWYACMFVTLMLPYQVVMVPQFIIFHRIGWVNTFLPLIVPHFGGVGFFIFLMVQFIRQIPMELDNAAKIDGCNRPMIFSYVVFPLIKPSLITAVIFSFYWRWDDFLGPLLYLNRPRQFTVSLALRMFSDPQSSTDWPAIFSMGTLSLIPVVLVFIIFQKYIVEGMVTTGIKG
ncbi:carbohydrate ABC transporter permease [Parasphaerochaeta coccoides]|uniref:Carbohydrate ABC transporter membrane protein 2, CUT1 family n=1 Tax=Parasphaerochaeta coccoides (strain ATCC BAA-1237 / DSM 17374 / SPN1) TaxID=760011 RepID=F4GHX8_PARC1|nr:carbohydrate ABC transporter permease [Parasphaerochaeta coccoides]AEC02091.1 carbohydrate ABC transporter membrane protein 2, CUT1 family [Parasphaerochaeta coccoides DSM 17374]